MICDQEPMLAWTVISRIQLRAVSLPSFGIIVQFIRHTTAEVLDVQAEHTYNISLKSLPS